MSVTTAETTTARLVEVFSAIQGEGLNVGTRQIFIRFALCDLRCHFCDSAHTWRVPRTYRVERSPGSRDFETYDNPVSLDLLLKWVQQLNVPGLHDSISLTGGEPLLHSAFLLQFLPQVQKRTGLPIYLETGGHRPQQLAMVLPHLNSVGMDLKLPSVSGESYWQEHAEFLQRCNKSGVEVFAKVIVSAETDSAELHQAAELVADVNPEIVLFLQPVTLLESAQRHSQANFSAPTPAQVLTWQAEMKRSLKHVRVVPQTHKMLNQL
ncbi:Radical SAM domain protein [Gloeocapsa sp. PCC 7428]|uniref:7-carboxy-7-deazaguanine synthase QueE n=1 Tax=Gloeocapsa sp. PCC 7428 TaxID=1173026 RepID=UPI0002A60F41|nr:7-carboxy-7-deazaguanine synthase QueE [Gloeocapsa sp. PCC 7428]AFZ32210.1 Radical SAM domain protein [Gloeocapsa sp. PCC 7428]